MSSLYWYYLKKAREEGGELFKRVREERDEWLFERGVCLKVWPGGWVLIQSMGTYSSRK